MSINPDRDVREPDDSAQPRVIAPPPSPQLARPGREPRGRRIKA